LKIVLSSSVDRVGGVNCIGADFAGARRALASPSHRHQGSGERIRLRPHRPTFCSFRRPFGKRFALCYRTVVPSIGLCETCVCGQTVGWIKMKLDMEVSLGAGHIVLDADPAPPPKKKGGGHSSHPIFGPCLVAKRLDGSTCHLVQR